MKTEAREIRGIRGSKVWEEGVWDSWDTSPAFLVMQESRESLERWGDPAGVEHLDLGTVSGESSPWACRAQCQEGVLPSS